MSHQTLNAIFPNSLNHIILQESARVSNYSYTAVIVSTAVIVESCSCQEYKKPCAISESFGMSPSLPGNYVFKVNNRNTRTRCEICSKLIIKTAERRQCCSDVFLFNFEHISHLVLVFLLLTLSR